MNAVVFTFSVIVANAADATAMKTKLESAEFKNGLLTQLGTLYTGKTIVVDVATPTIDDYTPATKDDSLSTGFKADTRNVAYALLTIFIFLFIRY